MSSPDKAEEPSKQVETEATGDPAWPPKEAAPVDEVPSPSNGTTAPTESAGAAAPTTVAGAAADTLTAAATRDPAAPLAVAAALPEQEMGFSPSTLHWLTDGEQPGEHSEPYRPSGAVPLAPFDPHAPVPGRRRALLVLGSASVLALAIAGGFFLSAERRPAAVTTAHPERPRRLSLAALRARYVDAARALPRRLEVVLAADPRPGARAILDAV